MDLVALFKSFPSFALSYAAVYNPNVLSIKQPQKNSEGSPYKQTSITCTNLLGSLGKIKKTCNVKFRYFSYHPLLSKLDFQRRKNKNKK